jgi:hypothetical protein
MLPPFFDFQSLEFFVFFHWSDLDHRDKLLFLICFLLLYFFGILEINELNNSTFLLDFHSLIANLYFPCRSSYIAYHSICFFKSEVEKAGRTFLHAFKRRSLRSCTCQYAYEDTEDFFQTFKNLTWYSDSHPPV